MSNKRFDPFKKLEELPSLVYVVLAVLCITIHVLLCTYTSISVAVCGLILIIAYAVMAFFIHLAVHKRISLFRIASDASEEQNNGVIYTFRHLLKIPYAVVTEKGKIVTVNAAMKNAAGAKSTGFNTDIKDICDISLESLMQTATTEVETQETDEEREDIEILKDKAAICSIGDKIYHVDCHPLYSKGKLFYLLMFNDITELQQLSITHRAEHTAVAYIVIDNLDEIAQYAKVNYQAEATQVDNILQDWAKSLGGIIREYDKHKYVMLFNRQGLRRCEKTKFEILDSIREIHVLLRRTYKESAKALRRSLKDHRYKALLYDIKRVKRHRYGTQQSRL